MQSWWTGLVGEWEFEERFREATFQLWLLRREQYCELRRITAKGVSGDSEWWGAWDCSKHTLPCANDLWERFNLLANRDYEPACEWPYLNVCLSILFELILTNCVPSLLIGVTGLFTINATFFFICYLLLSEKNSNVFCVYLHLIQLSVHFYLSLRFKCY